MVGSVALADAVDLPRSLPSAERACRIASPTFIAPDPPMIPLASAAPPPAVRAQMPRGGRRGGRRGRRDLVRAGPGHPLPTDPSPWLECCGLFAALVGVGLLVIDVALPAPSGLVMVAHGALFGAAVGTLLSVVGSTGAALVGFALGRRGGPLLARLVPPEERVRANRLVAR